MKQFLTAVELTDALSSFAADDIVSVTRIRYKNRQEIRRQENIRCQDLMKFLESCLLERHQPGGDLELKIPALGQTLVGHHDGLYWLEPSQEK